MAHPLRKYASTETAKCVNVSSLSKKVKKHIIENDPEIPRNSEGRPIRACDILTKKMVEAMKALSLDGQKFEFEHYPNQLGGTRWYAICPGCSRRFLKLYRPSSDTGKPQSYMCADCHNLKTPSALFGPTPKYREVIRPIRRMEKIKEIMRLNKKMSDEETVRLLDEYEALKAELEKSVIYRRIKFSIETEGLDPATLLS
jgi:hypothetical protein